MSDYSRILRGYDKQKKRYIKRLFTSFLLGFFLSTSIIGVIALYETTDVRVSEFGAYGDFDRVELVQKRISGEGIPYEGRLFASIVENGTVTFGTNFDKGETYRFYIFVYNDGTKQIFEEVAKSRVEKIVEYNNITLVFNLSNVITPRTFFLVDSDNLFGIILSVGTFLGFAFAIIASQSFYDYFIAKKAYEQLKAQ